jgi:hypothetical protein
VINQGFGVPPDAASSLRDNSGNYCRVQRRSAFD